MCALVAMVIACAIVTCPLAASAQSHWVAPGANGKLEYGHFATGDRIPDFSTAGYRGGGVALPDVAVRRTVVPSGADDTDAIQHAIDEVGKLPLTDGSRGAVVLAKGTFHCGRPIVLSVSGVVLRGAGTGAGGTTLLMTGEPHTAIRVAGTLNVETAGKKTHMADAYVPEGATTFKVEDASGFHAGDTLLIVKEATPAWVHFMGMDTLGMRNGKPEVWVRGMLKVRRRIASIAGNAVTLETPLMDSYDAKYVGASSVTKVSVSGQIAEVGIEDLSVVAPARSVTVKDNLFDGLRMVDAVDSWVRNLSFRDTTSSVGIDEGTERISVVSVDAVNTLPIVGAAKAFIFESIGQQILFDRCTGSGDSTFYFATQSGQQGPVVLLHCRFLGNGSIQPHQRWSTGLLVDNCEVPGGSIDLMNRGMMGSGHGWAIGWSVIWNSTAKSFAVNQAPGTANWSIGNTGQETDPPQPAMEGGVSVPLHAGIVESAGKRVKPESLYLQQLADRLGAAALRNIGYP